MAFANGSGARVAYVAETAYATTPATPTFKVLRVTGGGMRTDKSTVVSDEIRADRNVAGEGLVGIDASGSYDFELTYGTMDDLLASALQGAWATNVLKNGVTPSYVTFEETLNLGGSSSFSRFTGCSVNSLSLSISAREKVTGTINLMGQKETLATSIVTGATYTAANSEPILTASGHVASLSVAAGTPKVRSLTLEIANNLRARPVVGSLYSEEPGSGRFEVTGTLQAYFESNALYQSVLDHGGGAISFTVGAATTKKYTISLPNVQFLNGSRVIGGNDQDIMVDIPYRAVYDGTAACSLQITRAVA